MAGFPKAKPPATSRVLDRWIADKARADGVAVDRARRSLSFMVVSAALSQLVDETGVPLFILKGGVAMELRFGLRARASKDYDTAFRQELARLEAVLDTAQRHPVGRFVVSAGPARPIGPTGALQILLTIRYGTQPWGKVTLEVSATEGGSGRADEIDYRKPSPEFSIFGIEEMQDDVPCFPLRYQIAQKLHACTEILGHKENARFQDLLDLLLLEELVAEDAWGDVRAACEEVFSLRGKQSWPPNVTVFPGWPLPYADLAERATFPITDVNEAADAVTAMIRRIVAG